MATKTFTVTTPSKSQVSEVSYTYTNTDFATQLNDIPPYAIINSVKITAEFKVNLYTNWGRLTVGSQTWTSAQTNSHDWYAIVKDQDIIDYLTGKSGTQNAGELPSITVYASKRSGFVRTFQTRLTITWDYSLPTYTVTWKNFDGSILETDTGVSSGETPTYNGSTPTKPMDKQYTYNFIGWEDANGNALGAISGNTTYTAQFEAKLREYQVDVSCLTNSGETCTVNGAGKYHYGDTAKFTFANMPKHHSFMGWKVPGDPNFVYTEDLELTIDDTFAAYTQFTVSCYIMHNGYLLKVNVLPDEKAGTVERGKFVNIDGKEEYGTSGVIPNAGYNVSYENRNAVAIKAISNQWYRFIKWSDGSTENPRKLFLTDDVTYTAIFETIEINNIAVNDVQPKAIYFDKNNVVFVVDGNIPSLSSSVWDTVNGFNFKVQNTVPTGMTEAREVYVDLKKYYYRS